VPDRATASGASPCADCAVEALVRAGSGREAGVFLRGEHATSDRYDAVMRDDGRLQLRRLDAGRPTVLADAALPAGARDRFVRLRLEARGAGPVSLSVSLDGAPALAASDPGAGALGGPGHAGLWTYSAGVRFDDFSISTAP